MANASTDAKLRSFQCNQISNKDLIAEYLNRLESLVDEPFDSYQSISKHVKLRSLLRGLPKDFKIASKAIQMSDKTFAEAVSCLVIKKSTRDDEGENGKPSAARLHTQGELVCKKKREYYKCGRRGQIAEKCKIKLACTYCKEKNRTSNRRQNISKSSGFKEGRGGSTYNELRLKRNTELENKSGRDFAIVTTASALYDNECDQINK